MSLDQFVVQNTGKQLADHSGNFLGECVSLAKQYAQSVQGVPNADVVLQVPKGARQLYEEFNWNGKMSQYYEKIPNGQPRQRGDLVVWGSNLGSYGDVAIALDSGNTVFGQLGTPVFKPANVRIESRPPLGYLRRKGEMETITKETLIRCYGAFFGIYPSDADFKNWVGKPELNNLIAQLEANPARKAYFDKVQAGFKALENQDANFKQVGTIDGKPIYSKG